MAIKFNNGIGAIICDCCRVIIKVNLTKEDLQSKGIHLCNSTDEKHKKFKRGLK